jgi:hypothetical protein
MYCRTMVLSYAAMQGRHVLIVQSEEKHKRLARLGRKNKDRHEKNSPVYKECFHCSNEGKKGKVCPVTGLLALKGR